MESFAACTAWPRNQARIEGQIPELLLEPIASAFCQSLLSMPIYAYKCETCAHAKDVLQKMSDPLLTECPSCGAATFKKQLTAAGFQLKGSGWYVTDFKDGGTAAKAAPAGEGGAKSPENAAISADGKSDAKSDGASGSQAAVAGAAGTPSETKTAAPASAPAAAAPAAAKASAPPASGG